MKGLKKFFTSRTNKPLAWSFEAGQGRMGSAFRRDYTITIHSVENNYLWVSMTFHDFDRAGTRVTRVPVQCEKKQIDYSEFESPIEVLEEIARSLDSEYFSNHPKVKVSGSESEANNILGKIKKLNNASTRGPDEGQPHPSSIERLIKFWESNPGLVLPDLFSTKEGTIRARWMDGAQKTLWINFPENGSLGWSVSIPRDGGYGLRKVNAKCINDEDIIPMATLLGIGCYKGKR